MHPWTAHRGRHASAQRVLRALARARARAY
jgi:hypothetical protein